ncbi:MAG: DUF3501 family protein [Burkholderiales bacterium]
MPAISRESLLTLESYAKTRKEFRAKVLNHKKRRTVQLGGHVTLIFEDELTIRYQIQEMLRVEKIFEEEGIQSELDAYNPLIPDGSNWKATMMIEYPDPDERQRQLQRLKGIEDRVWVQAGTAGRVYAIADEDLERENETKTSAVHFLRFELTPAMKKILGMGGGLAMGVDHPNYRHGLDPVPPDVHDALIKDLKF